MKRLLMAMTILNTVFFVAYGSPYHALGAAVGAIYLMVEGDKNESE